MTYPEIKDLDGIYIRVERKGKWMSLCLSDCTSEERKAWLQKLDRTALDNVKNHFIACFDEMSKAIMENRDVVEMLKNMYKTGFASNRSKAIMVHVINDQIELFRKVADNFEITRNMEEEDEHQ